MIAIRHEVIPLDLLMSGGGSIAAAARIMGDLMQEAIDAGATLACGMGVRASWIAFIATETGIGQIDWDPTTPIPVGTLSLRCTAYSVPA